MKNVSVFLGLVLILFLTQESFARGGRGGRGPRGHRDGLKTGHSNRWDKNHPERAKLLNDTHNEKKEIREEYKEGKISKDTEKSELREANQIRRQQRRMARGNKNGGHLNKEQSEKLNQEDSALQQKINSQEGQ